MVNQPTIDTVKQFAKNLLGRSDCTVTYLGSGKTSIAWLITYNAEKFVLRATYPATNRPITYQSEFVILRELYKQGLPVPEPLYNSFEQPIPLDNGISAWAITRVVLGQSILKNKLNATVASDIGTFLRVLHDLPCANFGRLTEGINTIQGQQSAPIDGIRARWCHAQLFPFDNHALSDHPIVTSAPHLYKPLTTLEATIGDIAKETKAVLTHSDLHGEHIFVADNQLSGVIDFGAALIALPSWDFAVLAHYHGWESVKHSLNSYTPIAKEKQRLLEQTRYLAVVISLYKLAKISHTKRTIDKKQQIIKFITETIASISN